MDKNVIDKNSKHLSVSLACQTLDNCTMMQRAQKEIPEGLMHKCTNCHTIEYSKKLIKNLKVCSSCGFHMRLRAHERIAMLIDEHSFIEYDATMVSIDPLAFPGYTSKLEQQTLKSGLKEAIITGQATIGSFPVVMGVLSFDFFTGSMGSVVGEKITRAIEAAIHCKIPLIIVSASGGARMQESILSLMQMAKTSAALSQLDEQGGLYISIITDPTMGGVSASFATLGDINIAEPGALFGFAGRVVIEQTIHKKLPDHFQTAEFNLQHGQLDMIVHRKKLRDTLIQILDIHCMKGEC